MNVTYKMHNISSEKNSEYNKKVATLEFHILGKLILLDKVLKTIKQDDLLENTRQAGDVLLTGLKELQAKFPQYLNSARGLGTFCAINCDSGPR